MNLQIKLGRVDILIIFSLCTCVFTLMCLVFIHSMLNKLRRDRLKVFFFFNFNINDYLEGLTKSSTVLGREIEKVHKRCERCPEAGI